MTINKGSSGRQGLNRRSFLKASAGTAALLGAVNTQFPFGAHIAQAAGPEVTKALLGFIALTDAAPLFVAEEKGIFAKYGVPDVEVQKQASWGATRDNLVLGSEGNGIDGAHILTPMPYLISAGKVTQNNVPTPMYILARLNLNGQCISVGKEYSDLKVGVNTAPLKAAFEAKKAAGKMAKAAMTFPGGTHDLWIRYWLAAGGIDPDKDVETRVVPPPPMGANMKVGTMACFRVGERGMCGSSIRTSATAIYRRDLGYRKNRSACVRLSSTNIECDEGHPDGAWKHSNGARRCGIAEVARFAPSANGSIVGRDVTDRMKENLTTASPQSHRLAYMMRYWVGQRPVSFQAGQWFLAEDTRWGKYRSVVPGTDQSQPEDLWQDAARLLLLPLPISPLNLARR